MCRLPEVVDAGGGPYFLRVAAGNSKQRGSSPFFEQLLKISLPSFPAALLLLVNLLIAAMIPAAAAMKARGDALTSANGHADSGIAAIQTQSTAVALARGKADLQPPCSSSEAGKPLCSSSSEDPSLRSHDWDDEEFYKDPCAVQEGTRYVAEKHACEKPVSAMDEEKRVRELKSVKEKFSDATESTAFYVDAKECLPHEVARDAIAHTVGVVFSRCDCRKVLIEMPVGPQCVQTGHPRAVEWSGHNDFAKRAGFPVIFMMIGSHPVAWILAELKQLRDNIEKCDCSKGPANWTRSDDHVIRTYATYAGTCSEAKSWLATGGSEFDKRKLQDKLLSGKVGGKYPCHHAWYMQDGELAKDGAVYDWNWDSEGGPLPATGLACEDEQEGLFFTGQSAEAAFEKLSLFLKGANMGDHSKVKGEDWWSSDSSPEVRPPKDGQAQVAQALTRVIARLEECTTDGTHIGTSDATGNRVCGPRSLVWTAFVAAGSLAAALAQY